MSGGFSFRLFPRFLLHLLGWMLLCLLLKDVVPPLWAWSAFPLAVFPGYLAGRLHFKKLPVISVILLLPWIVRLAVFAISSVILSDFPVRFDNGWFLTAPYLYFSALSFFLVERRPGMGYIEILILAGFSILLPRGDAFWPHRFSGPVVDTLELLLTIFIILLAMFSLAAVKRDDEIRISGLAPKRPAFSPGKIFYGIVLTAAFALLLLGGNRIRRDQSIQSGGGLLASDMFRFDFSDVLSLEPEISLNAELTMLYREDGPAVLRYLRRYTLSGWDDNNGFFRDGENESLFDAAPIPITLPKGPRSWPEGKSLARVNLRQEYYLVALDPESFFALNYPVSVEPWTIWDDASFTRAYAVESRVSEAGPWELMDSGSGNEKYFLKGGDNPYFIKLAEDITEGLDDRWSKAAAIERWFHENYYYSLNPGLAPDGDQLGWFLNESRRGYCSYFAFAMTRICRAAGIPARVSVGFLTDPDTSTLGFTPVRSDQAHAWVEVWFDEYGWITFDPTSDVMAPGEDYPFQFISPDEWLHLIEEVLTRSGEVSVSIEEDDKPVNEGPWWKRVSTLVRRRPWLTWISAVLILLFLYLPGRILPGFINLYFLFSRYSRRRVIGAWRLFARRLNRGAYTPLLNETPLDWAFRVEAAGIQGFTAWTKLYLKAEYSPRFDNEDEIGAGTARLETLGNWRNTALSRRFRAFFSPGLKGGFPW